MKRMIFIYNPNAGKGALKSGLSDILDIFVKAGYEIVIYPTQKYKDAYAKVKALKDEYDLVVCSGGDGTLDEVVMGMMQRENRMPIGYIPTGTTNDFANSLHIPKNRLEAADTAVNGKLFNCDVGRFNKETFVYIAAFGLFTDVAYQTRQEIKNVLGHLAYVLEGAKRIFNIPSYAIRVTYDGGEIRDKFIFGMVTNSKSVGGFRGMIGKEVVFDDGMFEVTLIKMPKNPLELNEIIGALLMEQVNTKHMYTFRTKYIRFESIEEIPWTLDGEFGGEHDEVEIENLQQQLQIMVPAEEIGALTANPPVPEIEDKIEKN